MVKVKSADHKIENLDSKIRKLRVLAASENWHIREGAGFELRNMMEIDFENVFNKTVDWISDENECVRRAGCLACMHRKAFGTDKRIKKILSRLRLLLFDESAYVKKCCGPFVVGYLGYTYPEITLPWLKKMSRINDDNVRWNVVKAFSQALGRKHSKEALEIIAFLKNDQRVKVQAAIKSTLRNIGNKQRA